MFVDSFDQQITVLVIESIVYILVLLAAMMRVEFQEQTARALMIYANVACLWVLTDILSGLGVFTELLPLPDHVLAHIPFYAIILLAVLMLNLTWAFNRTERRSLIWWLFGLVLLLGLVLIDIRLIPNAPFASVMDLPLVLASLGGFIYLMMALWITLKTHHQARQPLHRNRLKYWLPVIFFILVGDLFFFYGNNLLDGLFRMAGVLLAAYATLTHHLLDIRQMTRSVVSYLLVTLLTIVFYTGGILTAQSLFEDIPGYNVWLGGAVVALVLAVIFQPLMRLVAKGVNRIIYGQRYDSQRTLGEYSSRISNILELKRLVAVVMETVSEVLGVRHGTLYLVQVKSWDDGRQMLQLEPVPGHESSHTETKLLSPESPFVEYLRYEHQSLAQYDVDMLPRFQDLPAVERRWLREINIDVYVPIYAQEMWIGLLALGPKSSGDRYFDTDLKLLNTLADQTAVALENARLVENLKQLNTDLKEAYDQLDLVNQQMQELDKLKSAFIGVITHELRTPYANLMFSLEILERYGRPNLPEELQEQMDQLSNGVRNAKRMIDNLVTFATYLSKQGELNLSEVDFRKLVKDSLPSLQSMATAKNISLHLHLPANLPLLSGDAERLGDAIYHLVQNAIKFTESGGKVWLQCESTPTSLRFEVQDTGVGIPANRLPDLWEGFTQMADPLQRGAEGLGLGLSLVKYVITAHNGEVWAQSEAGVGSTFGFEIPHEAPQATAPLPPESEPTIARKTGTGPLVPAQAT